MSGLIDNRPAKVNSIPSGWQLKRLGEIARIKTGGKNNDDKVEDGEYPLFVRSQTVERINSYSYDCEAILVPGEGGIGSIFHYIRGRFDVHQRVYAITQFAPNVSGKFVYLYMVMNFGDHAMKNSVKATVDSLRLPTFLEFEVALPPTIEEQTAIATALSEVDALLAKLDQLIAKKRDLKQATMQQLLTGQKRLPGFSGEWDATQLGALGAFLKGSGIKKDEARSGEIPCIRYGEIYTHHNDYVKAYNSRISPAVATTATPLKQGDLLFAGSGETKEEIGKCVAFVEDVEAYAGGDIVILRPRAASAIFLGYYCNTAPITAQKASRGQGDAVVHISATALSSIDVTLPGLDEQIAIATVLSDMDTELAAVEARRNKTLALKQGMMQELLTGTIRLV